MIRKVTLGLALFGACVSCQPRSKDSTVASRELPAQSSQSQALSDLSLHREQLLKKYEDEKPIYRLVQDLSFTRLAVLSGGGHFANIYLVPQTDQFEQKVKEVHLGLGGVESNFLVLDGKQGDLSAALEHVTNVYRENSDPVLLYLNWTEDLASVEFKPNQWLWEATGEMGFSTDAGFVSAKNLGFVIGINPEENWEKTKQSIITSLFSRLTYRNLRPRHMAPQVADAVSSKTPQSYLFQQAAESRLTIIPVW